MSEATYKVVSFDVDALDIFGGQSERGTPERNLLMAVLERAILDFVGNDQKEVNHAEQWLFEDEEKSNDQTPFSFAWVCQQLDLDRNFVAETVRAMPKRGTRRVAPWYFMKQAG